MKTEKELKILLKIKQACEDMLKKGYEFQEYEKEHQLSFEVKDKKKLFTSWYSAVSDVLGSILKSEPVFANNSSLWSDLKSYTAQQLTIPSSLSFLPDDDISLERVIRIARNYYEHPDKDNQERYVLLADFIPNQMLMQTAYKITLLVKAELKTLSDEELQIMIGENVEFKRQVSDVQKLLKDKYLPVLETDDRFTPEMKKMLISFLEFVPSKDNVKIDTNLQ